jgi:hypothetical protein
MNPSPFHFDTDKMLLPEGAARLAAERPLSEDELQALINDLGRLADRARQKKRRKIFLAFIALLGIGYAFLLQLLIVFAVAGLLLVYIFMASLRIRKVREVDQLSQVNDSRIVGPLIGIYRYADIDTRDTVRNTLLRLLPELRANDASALNSPQREELRLLLEEEDGQLILAILKALQQIGDAQDLDAVEKVMGQEWRKPAVREAAEACLPFLRSNIQQQRTSQTLLRASDPPSAPTELLRPALPTESEPQELLRPSTGQGRGKRE